MTKPPAYYTQKAYAAYYTQKAYVWMRATGVSDVKRAKIMVKSIIAMCPDGKNVGGVTISTADRSVKLDVAMRQRAKEILKGLNLLEGR